MGRWKTRFTLVVLALSAGPWASAQPDETAANRYFPLLQQQPGNSYLYDRFYQAWFESGTAEQLETFLRSNLEQRKDIGSRLLLALYYERQGDDAQALELYRTVPAGLSVTGEYLYYRARAEARHLDFETAIADLVAARKQTSSEEIAAKTGRLLGELYIRTDRKDEAMTLWRELLAAGEENHELCEDLIELQIKEGLFDDALATSEELIALTKDPYKAVMRRLRLGDIHQYKGDHDRALDVYTGALDKVGEGSWLEDQIYAQIEQVFDRDDNVTGLKDYLQDLVAVHPKRTGLKKRLAHLLLRTGEADAALAMFQEIVDVTPGETDNQKAYARLLVEAGHVDKAIQLLEQLAARDRQDSEIWISLADLYHRSQQDGKAGTALNRFLDLADKTEYSFLRVAGLLEQYGLKPQAESVYRRTIQTWPESSNARHVYAEFLYRLDRKDQALDLFRALAGVGDLQGMMRATNAVGTRGHGDLALQWAEARYREFSDDVTYLNHLCKLAIRQKEFNKAIVWALHQLRMAQDFGMIRAALSQVMATMDSDERAERMVREMESMARLTIQQACLLSELLESLDRPDRADGALAQAMQVHPDIATRQQIHLYRLRRDWTRAAESLEALMARTGTREPSLLRELVELYENSGRYEDALKRVLEWKKVSPTSAAPRLSHARLLSAMGQGEEAVDAMEAASREFEGDTEVLSQLAQLYASTGRLEEAQRTYWRLYEAAQNVPEKLRCINEMAGAAEKAGTREALIERLQSLRQRDRSSAVPLLGLAEVYKQMGRYEERRQALLEASRLQTEDIALLYELASVEEAQGHWQKAIETLERALALDNTSETRLKIARLHIQHGNRGDGFRILTEVAGGEKMDPRDAESIADTMMSIGAWDAAVRLLQGLLPAHPQDYKLHYQHAVALEELGRTAEAVEAFVDLLGVRQEIPGNTDKPLSFTWSRQGMDTNIERILPAEAVALLRLDQRRATAYRYRQQRIRFNRFPNQSAHISSQVAVPPTVQDLRDFALAHILTLAENLDDSSRAQIASDLSRYDIANVDVLMALSEYGWPDCREAIERLSRVAPDHEAIQAVWIMQRIEGQGGTLQEAEHIFNLFETSYPRLALIVGLRCYGRDPIASRLFKKSLEMLRDVPDPGYYEINAITYVLQNSHPTVGLTTEQRAFLDRHLLEWYAKLNKKGGSHTHIFNHVGSLLCQRRDLREYVKFLDREIAEHGNSAPSVGSSAPGRPLIWHLSYPPRDVPGFPDHVREMVFNGPRHYFPMTTTRSKAEPERLGRCLDQVEDPVLKILIAMVSGQKEEADKLTKALLEEAPASLAAHLLAASQATVYGEPLEVVTLLDRARSLPMSHGYSRLLDGALVAAAMELDPKEHPAEIELGRRAVLRLMSGKMNPEQREELLVAAELLGLTEEAQNLRRQIATATGTPSTPTAQYSVSSQPYTVALIERFLDKQQTDAALRLALNHLRNEVQNTLYGGLYGNPSHMATEIVKLLGRHRAVNELMQLAAPPEVTTARRLVEYGRICELLERKTEAMAAYEKAVALNPEDPAARVRLALMSVKTNPRESARHLAAISRRAMNGAGQGLARLVQHLFISGDVQSALDITEVVVEYLDLVEEPEKQNLDWVDRVADAIADSCWHLRPRSNLALGPSAAVRARPSVSFRSGFQGLRGLYETSPEPTTVTRYSGGSYSFRMGMTVTSGSWGGPVPAQMRGTGGLIREDPQLAKTRRSLHTRLCRKMLEIPQLAEMAFSRLAAEAEARGVLKDQYVDLARQAMLTHKPYYQAGPFKFTFTGTARVRFLDPAEYLVRRAYEKGTVDGLVREFVPELRQNGGDLQAGKLERVAEIYSVQQDRFFDAAEDFVSAGGLQGSTPRPVGRDEIEPARVVIDAYLTRGLDRQQVMEPFILEKIEEDIRTGRFVHHSLAECWLKVLIDRDRAAARTFLDSVLALYRSPEGKVSGLEGMFKPYERMLDNRFENIGRLRPGLPRTGRQPAINPRTGRTRTRRNAGTRRRP